MARVRQSRPGSVLGFQADVLDTFGASSEADFSQSVRRTRTGEREFIVDSILV